MEPAGTCTAAEAVPGPALDASVGITSRRAKVAFEMVVLGSGGGPLETNCSGWIYHAFVMCESRLMGFSYLLKPAATSWEDGIVALEGGT